MPCNLVSSALTNACCSRISASARRNIGTETSPLFRRVGAHRHVEAVTEFCELLNVFVFVLDPAHGRSSSWSMDLRDWNRASRDTGHCRMSTPPERKKVRCLLQVFMARVEKYLYRVTVRLARGACYTRQRRTSVTYPALCALPLLWRVAGHRMLAERENQLFRLRGAAGFAPRQQDRTSTSMFLSRAANVSVRLCLARLRRAV